VIEQGEGVRAEGKAPATIRVVAEAKGAVVERDAGEVPGEEGHLLPPGKVIATLAVGKQDGGTGPVDFIVELNAVNWSKGHEARIGPSAASGQLSAVSFQLSAFSDQLSVVSCQLSVVDYRFSRQFGNQ
jgi:hypothetical protein